MSGQMAKFECRDDKVTDQNSAWRLPTPLWTYSVVRQEVRMTVADLIGLVQRAREMLAARHGGIGRAGLPSTGTHGFSWRNTGIRFET